MFADYHTLCLAVLVLIRFSHATSNAMCLLDDGVLSQITSVDIAISTQEVPTTPTIMGRAARVWGLWAKFADELSGNYLAWKETESDQVYFQKGDRTLTLFTNPDHKIHIEVLADSDGARGVRRRAACRLGLRLAAELRISSDFRFVLQKSNLETLKQDDPAKLVKIDSSETKHGYAKDYPEIWGPVSLPDWDDNEWVPLKDEGVVTIRLNFAAKSSSRGGTESRSSSSGTGSDTESHGFWTPTKVTVALILALAAIGVGSWLLYSTISQPERPKKDVKTVEEEELEDDPDVENPSAEPEVAKSPSVSVLYLES